MFKFADFAHLAGPCSALDGGPDFSRPTAKGLASMRKDLGSIAEAHFERASDTAQANTRNNLEAWNKIAEAWVTPLSGQHWLDYGWDVAQRAVLYTDALRQRGNYFAEHEEGSNKTVLSWDHDVVVDGTTLARPVNYSLVRIVPPQGVSVHEDRRPYIIIDPRAGHGSGIGGFKDASQVGAAIYQGHPTYFVTFTRLPVPGQTLADVTVRTCDLFAQRQGTLPFLR